MVRANREARWRPLGLRTERRPAAISSSVRLARSPEVSEVCASAATMRATSMGLGPWSGCSAGTCVVMMRPLSSMVRLYETVRSASASDTLRLLYPACWMSSLELAVLVRLVWSSKKLVSGLRPDRYESAIRPLRNGSQAPRARVVPPA